jgi:hypothetical protein
VYSNAVFERKTKKKKKQTNLAATLYKREREIYIEIEYELGLHLIFDPLCMSDMPCLEITCSP